MNIIVVGLSHKTVSVEIREKLNIQEATLKTALTYLRQQSHIEEVAILNTCNRVEIYAVARETQQVVGEIIQFLSEIGEIPIHQLRQHLFILLNQEAIRHLMRVAAGLESLILGEEQILCQIRKTYRLAQQYKGLGWLLDHLFKHAITAGKRVRSETKIGMGAISISSAAVELAQTFDISVPRNVHSNVNELDNVEVYNVDDLKAVVAQNQKNQVQEAEVLLEEELETFVLWWQSLETVLTIRSLRNKVEDIREQELEKTLSRLGAEFTEKYQEVMEALTRRIINKILHEPMVQLRTQRDHEARRCALQSLQMLFNLDMGEQLSSQVILEFLTVSQNNANREQLLAS